MLSESLNILNITSTSGELSPEFSQETYDYATLTAWTTLNVSIQTPALTYAVVNGVSGESVVVTLLSNATLIMSVELYHDLYKCSLGKNYSISATQGNIQLKESSLCSRL
jgi:hypothetical protein